MTITKESFIQTWEIHQRINLYHLDSIDDSYLKDVSASKGRNVSEQFVHIHNVRLMWLNQAVPELMDDLSKIEKEGLSKSKLVKGLSESSKAIVKLLTQGSETGRIKVFKSHSAAFLGYLISHESHHRGKYCYV